MWVVKFTKNAEKDKKLLKSAGLEEKVKKLLNLIAQNPFQNPPSMKNWLVIYKAIIREELIFNIGSFTKFTKISILLLFIQCCRIMEIIREDREGPVFSIANNYSRRRRSSGDKIGQLVEALFWESRI